MAFNKNELILDRIRSATAHKLDTHEMFMRLTSIEEPSLVTNAEGEDVTDALGSLITTLYRAKTAEFSGTNSLVSIDLLAAQYGAEKEVATSGKKIKVPTFETIDVPAPDPDNTGAAVKVNLKNNPVANSVKYVYGIVGGEIATSYKFGASVSATEFTVGTTEITVNGTQKTVGEITVPTGFSGKMYVEYEYESEEAARVVNSTENFPEACELKIYAIFRDKCNENLKYAGVIYSPKAKLSPESIELALTATGKHPFTFRMLKDYCEDSAELFSVIIAGDQE